MEAFKYITEAHLTRIQHEKVLTPRRSDGRTYAIPEDPQLWGDHTQELFNHLIKQGNSSILLVKFEVNEQDPDVGVQEGSLPVWDKMDTRVWIRDYVKEDFILPEIVLFRSIPLNEICLIGKILFDVHNLS